MQKRASTGPIEGIQNRDEQHILLWLQQFVSIHLLQDTYGFGAIFALAHNECKQFEEHIVENKMYDANSKEKKKCLYHTFITSHRRWGDQTSDSRLYGAIVVYVWVAITSTQV